MSTVPKDSLPAPVQPPEVDKLKPATGMGIVSIVPPQQNVIGPPVFARPKPAKQEKY